MTRSNPTRARAHYAAMSLQAATLAAIAALRDLLDAQPNVGRPTDPRGIAYLDLSRAARVALDNYNRATIDMAAVILTEDSQ